ncbi:MAG: hypothetical protein ACYTGW_00580 [Planctomycetota bacterium]|jgi:hypothetical protein
MSRNNRPRLSLPSSILAGVTLMFAMPLAAQAASYTYISQPNSFWHAPWLTALSLPKIGTAFKFQVPNGPGVVYPPGGYPIYYVAFGLSNPNVRHPGLGAPGNGDYLFTSAEILMPATQDWTGYPNKLPPSTVTMSFPIPDSSTLLGVRFYQQVLEVYRCNLCYPYFTHLSRGVAGVIGK